MNLSTIIPLALGSALFLGSAQAAVITWSTAQDTTAISNISTTGTFISAVNGGTSGTTVNGVTFTAGAPLTKTGSNTGTGLLNGATTGNTNFDTLLDEVNFGGGSGTATVTISGLTLNSIYQIQVFFTDQRTGANDRVMTFNSPGGTAVNVAADPGQADASPYGQYAIGTFTASGSTQDLILEPGGAGFGHSHLTAYQVRLVPEPSSAALLGLGGLALILRRRK